jgi:hypothetical protein
VASFESLRHTPPQTVMSETVHTHAPDRQVCPVGHVVPQVPQLLASLDTSTQRSLHTVVLGLGQPHWPCVHMAPLAHAFPHEPQLPRSVFRS